VQQPPSESICVDCGGIAHLLTPPREDGTWLTGDVVTYRCSDCRDRWDIILEDDDV
jgi:DNA-directed RNA polymerase subunit RPC12/RpoP